METYDVGVNCLRKFIYIVTFILFGAALLLTGCNNKVLIEDNKNLETNNEVDLKIMTTNKLLYYMVKDVVKDKHYVNYMFKNETEQWNFTFSKDSLENVSNQNLFIYIGANFEPWMDSFVDGLNKGSVGVIDVARGVKLIDYNNEVKYNDEVLEENPYYWLDIDNYKVMMLNIKNVIEEKDPKNRGFYEDNFSKAKKEADGYEKELKALAEKTKDCLFLAQGDTLDYFLKDNNLKYLKLDDYYNLPPEKRVERSDFEKKLKEAKKLILLCTCESDKNINETLINEYKIRTVNIIAYKEGYTFQQIIKNNIDNLSNAVSK